MSLHISGPPVDEYIKCNVIIQFAENVIVMNFMELNVTYTLYENILTVTENTVDSWTKIFNDASLSEPPAPSDCTTFWYQQTNYCKHPNNASHSTMLSTAMVTLQYRDVVQLVRGFWEGYFELREMK